jgi:TRAP-type C4-dicarboxylate transport system permease small subunit
MRYVLGTPLVWSEELSRYLFIWVCYLGWVFATRSGTHIRISAFFNVLPLSLQKGVAVVNNILVLIFALVLGWLGYQMVLKNLDIPTITLFFTYAFVYLAVPVMNFFIVLQVIFKLLKGKEKNGGALP